MRRYSSKRYEKWYGNLVDANRHINSFKHELLSLQDQISHMKHLFKDLEGRQTEYKRLLEETKTKHRELRDKREHNIFREARAVRNRLEDTRDEIKEIGKNLSYRKRGVDKTKEKLDKYMRKFRRAISRVR